MVKDMTTGKPLKQIMVFFTPMMFSTIFQQLYNVTDSIVVGKFISKDALAAVGTTSSINFLLISFIIGFSAGESVLVSQEFGRRDYDKMRRCIANGIYVLAVVGLIVTSFSVIYCRSILKLLNTPSDIFDSSYIYFITIIAGYPITVATNYIGALIRSVGDAKNSMIRGIISTFINIGMDLIFVLAFNLGVFGVALATVVAQAINLLIALGFYIKCFPELHVTKKDFKIDKTIIGKTIGIGLPMGLQSSITMIGCTVIQSAVNSLGTTYVAAFTTATKIENMITTPIQTLTASIVPFIAQNYGAKKPDRIRICIRQVFLICVAYGLIIGATFAFTGRYIALMYINSYEQETLSLIAYYCRLSGMFYTMLCILYVIRNVIQALGSSLFTAIGGVVELLTRVAVSFLLISHFGYTVICLSNPMSWFFTNIFLIFAYFTFVRKKINMPTLQQITK